MEGGGRMSARRHKRVRRKSHLFTLSPVASEIMNSVPSGQKSRRVSEAIQWYHESPTYGREYDENYEWTGKFVKSSHGVPTPVVLMETIDKLHEKIERLDQELARCRSTPRQKPSIWEKLRLKLK